ncbi:MAG TPA: hypothetical protein VK891_05570 [Euzebyales bacterium]|nr:hypothetical protein [Euzebyales bacterium]
MSASLAARAVAGLDADVPPTVGADRAWAARSAAPQADRRWTRVPLGAAAAVVALLVAVLLVVTPTGRRAAADFLEQFRSERFEVITFDPNQPSAATEGLDEIADVDMEHPEPVAVDNPAAAEDVVGFAPAPVRGLPDGARAEQTMASPPTTVRLTFRADHAPDLPAALDGASLVISVPGSVVTQYEVGQDMLVVAEAGQLVAEAEGAELGAIRDYVLSRPEVPEDLARQLLAIDDWTATLPIPVPVDEIAWRETTVAGEPGLMLTDPMGSGVLWQRDGQIHAIGGSGIDVERLRQIADGVGG